MLLKPDLYVQQTHLRTPRTQYYDTQYSDTQYIDTQFIDTQRNNQ
jgi:hypothetical protein